MRGLMMSASTNACRSALDIWQPSPSTYGVARPRALSGLAGTCRVQFIDWAAWAGVWLMFIPTPPTWTVPRWMVMPDAGPVRRQGDGTALTRIRDLDADDDAHRKRDGDQGGDQHRPGPVPTLPWRTTPELHLLASVSAPRISRTATLDPS